MAKKKLQTMSILLPAKYKMEDGRNFLEEALKIEGDLRFTMDLEDSKTGKRSRLVRLLCEEFLSSNGYINEDGTINMDKLQAGEEELKQRYRKFPSKKLG